MRIPIAIAGVGKIARDQHVPAIRNSDRFELVATVTRSVGLDGVPNFPTIEAMVAALPVSAIAICTPPIGRASLVEQAARAGLAIMIEKPPAATLGAAQNLSAIAAAHRVPLFATWHSREAAGVETARAWLAGRKVNSVDVRWHEQVREWHPGQEWIWTAGIGVFDPAINAFSILTSLFGPDIEALSSELDFPANKDGPIAGRLMLQAASVPINVTLDFDWCGAPLWRIDIHADGGCLALHEGGGRVTLDDSPLAAPGHGEYPGLYRRFAELIDSRSSDVDLSPLRLVADCFFIARRNEVRPFDW